MNVKFNQYSPDDLAKLINVDGASIRYLCRLGIIDATNVSDGTSKARWLIPDSEVNYILDVVDKRGKRKLGQTLKMLRGQKNTQESKPKAEEKPKDAVIAGININKVAELTYRVADIKEELANIDARKNQLETELQDIKSTILEVLGV